MLISLICLKYIALLEKQNLLTKNGNGARDVLGDYESVTVPVGRDRKIRTALRANQIAGFVTVPSEKKNLSTVGSNLKVFLFFSWNIVEEQMENLEIIIIIKKQDMEGKNALFFCFVLW